MFTITSTTSSLADKQSLFDAFNRYSLGLNAFLDDLSLVSESYGNYPLTDVSVISENEIKVELALAGFQKSELQVYTENGRLFVVGTKETKSKDNYLGKKNIAQRSFKWSRVIQEHWKFDSAKFENGLLTLTLKRQVPEHQKRVDYQI